MNLKFELYIVGCSVYIPYTYAVSKSERLKFQFFFFAEDGKPLKSRFVMFWQKNVNLVMAILMLTKVRAAFLKSVTAAKGYAIKSIEIKYMCIHRNT